MSVATFIPETVGRATARVPEEEVLFTLGQASLTATMKATLLGRVTRCISTM